MFPIDDGSRQEFNVFKEDVEELKADQEYLSNYRDAVRLALKAWGWDVDAAQMYQPQEKGMGWTNWDVRLAKICRSLWLFEQADYLDSVQKFARVIKPNGGFRYAGINLDEILYMRLPHEGTKSPPSPHASDDNQTSNRIKPPKKGMGWSNWDVCLAKTCRVAAV
eukprot:gene15645-23880_t